MFPNHINIHKLRRQRRRASGLDGQARVKDGPDYFCYTPTGQSLLIHRAVSLWNKFLLKTCLSN